MTQPLNIKHLGTVKKCPAVLALTKGKNPEFYEFTLFSLPLNFEAVFLKHLDHWFHYSNAILCYDKDGMPAVAVTKTEDKDQEFGVSINEDSDKKSDKD